jgi:CTP:molybdopterin cytidylyltransferase MocA
VQAGLAALPPATPAIAIWPVDHPLVATEDVAALVATARAQPECTVVLPSHQGRAGHPALVRRPLFPAILALPPETPLRDLLRGERARTAFVERSSDHVLVDLDTPDDLAAARRRLAAEERGA